MSYYAKPRLDRKFIYAISSFMIMQNGLLTYRHR